MNQETQCVVKGTMNVPNVAVNSPDCIGNKKSLHGGVGLIGFFRHIHLKGKGRKLSKENTAPTKIDTNNGGNSSHIWRRRHRQDKTG